MRSLEGHGLFLCVACVSALGLCPWCTGGERAAQYRAVVIQGAGFLPDGKKPEGADAVTQATTKTINTYSLTEALAAKLTALGTKVTVVQASVCKDLSCLDGDAGGGRERADMVIFAGPSHFSKQPEPLVRLYPKLKEAAGRNPGLVASALVPAWYPESKGAATLLFAEKAFKEAGVGSVPGVTVLTPREERKGASATEIGQALSDFAVRLMDGAKRAR